jgi:hypothetical protein
MKNENVTDSNVLQFLLNYYFLESPVIIYLLSYSLSFLIFTIFDVPLSVRMYMFLLIFLIINVGLFLKCDYFRNNLLYCWDSSCSKNFVYNVLRIILVLNIYYLYINSHIML